MKKLIIAMFLLVTAMAGILLASYSGKKEYSVSEVNDSIKWIRILAEDNKEYCMSSKVMSALDMEAIALNNGGGCMVIVSKSEEIYAIFCKTMESKETFLGYKTLERCGKPKM